MERTSRMDKRFIVTSILICILYLVLRLSFPETIEFGYDQPRLATRVIEFINNGNILETQKFAEKAPWGNISWGPALFYFYSPFLILTRNPLMISYLVSIFNIVSVLGVIYLTTKHISKKAGLFAGLILATQPWWVIFSRMIYQPTPVISLVIISMLLFFAVIKKPNSPFYSLYILLLAVLVEIYAHTISFAIISVLLLVVYLKRKIFNRFLFLGFILSLSLILPFFVNFAKEDYLPANSQNVEENFKIGRDDPISRFNDIIPGYLKTFAGGNMEYQLGYSYSEFNKKIPIKYFEILISILTIIVLLYNLVKIFSSEELRFERITFLLWSISPLLFLILMPFPNVPPIPRYFLISFPALSILYGLFFSETYRFSKAVLILLLIPIFWIYFMYSYSNFIKNYDFPNGHLSMYSDTQYLFLFNALKEANSDSLIKGHGEIIISNDESFPKEYSLDYTTRYTLRYMFNNKLFKKDINAGYYLIDYSLDKSDLRFDKIGRFGPYSLYEFKDL